MVLILNMHHILEKHQRYISSASFKGQRWKGCRPVNYKYLGWGEAVTYSHTRKCREVQTEATELETLTTVETENVAQANSIWVIYRNNTNPDLNPNTPNTLNTFYFPSSFLWSLFLAKEAEICYSICKFLILTNDNTRYVIGMLLFFLY